MGKKNLFGNLLDNDAMYRADTIVEDMSQKVPQRKAFYSTSPTMSWGSAVGFYPGMTELLYGPKSSGKTMIVLDRIKHALAEDPDTVAVLVDAEMNFEYESTIRWMAANGVPTHRVMIVRDVCIQNIFESHLLEKIQKEIVAGNVKLAYIGMDSIAAMSPKNVPQTEAAIKSAAKGKKSYYTNQDYGARANYLARIFPFYRMFCRDHRVFTSFINQARDDGEDRFGNVTYKTNGGEALYHEVQYRTLVTPWGQPIYSDTQSVTSDNGVKIGHRIKFKFEKNKAGEGQDREGFCDIVYMKGIVNVEQELTVLATKLGIINQSGAWYNFDDEVKAQGIDGFAKKLADSPDVYQLIYSRVMQQASSNPAMSIKFDENVDPTTGEIIGEQSNG